MPATTALPALPALPVSSDGPGGAVRLSDWGVIRAEGAEAAKFLHGQLTQDVEHLRTDQARLAGYCSAKGRLLASFVLWRPRPDEVLLACSADLLAPTLKRLKMFVLRAKCVLTDASADTALYGLAGAAAGAWLGDAAPATAWGAAQQVVPGTATDAAAAAVPNSAATLVRLPDVLGQPRFLLAQPAAAAAPDLPAMAEDHWRWLEVHSGVPRVVAATVEQFVPQMVNLELVGGVDFKKGCYPGQEVVARSQYRGTTKRRMALFQLANPSAAKLLPGQEVFHSADPTQPAGLVALAASGPAGQTSVLVEIKLAVLDAGSVHAGAADGPALQRGALPYAYPADAG